MKDLESKLNRELAGEARFDEFNRHLYSIDASICQVKPVGVVLPKNRTDVEATLALAREEGLSIVPRGGATGTAGGCLGEGIVLDFSKYMTTIREVDPEAQTAICEPGVVQDHLTAHVASHGLRFGPDTSTGNRATLGGMIGNNSSGAHSMRYGKTVDNVVALEVVLADGSVLNAEELDDATLDQRQQQGGRQGDILSTVNRLRHDLAEEIVRVYPKLQRRVAGYNLDEFVSPRPFNLAKLITGSEGTLGVVTEATVKLAKSPAATGVCVLHVDDLIAGLKQVPFILESAPFALELIDRNIIEMGQVSPIMKGRLGWLEGDPDGLLVVEFDGDSEGEVADKLQRFAKQARSTGLGYAHVLLDRQQDIDNVWTMRKAGLGLLMARRTNEKAVAFLEDVAVPPEHIGDFIEEFRQYIDGVGKGVGLFGHAGVGQIHTRPMMDLHQQHDVDLMLQMMEDVNDMVGRYGGTISGEHGDGIIRSWLVERSFGPQIYQAFRDIKAAFDPDNRMNPGKILDALRPEEHLRVGPDTRYRELQTQFDFGPEGGFAFAVEMCNGNGECRKLNKGPMCPSYQVTRDERDSTRARATALQEWARGAFDSDSLGDERLLEVLDLCLQCKGCKYECPSQVDMARLKSEVLHHHHEAHGVPMRSRIFGAVDTLGWLGSGTAPLSNWLLRSPLGGTMNKLIGITPQRQLPPYSRLTFTNWLSGQEQPESDQEVALLVDTYMQYNYPDLGQAVVRVLNALGIRVRTAGYSCCGRPLISKGLLKKAKPKAHLLVHLLMPFAEQGVPIIGVEPSCILTIRDEYRTLVPGKRTEQVAAACQTIDEYLATQCETPAFADIFRSEKSQAWLHGHCHQKAVSGTSPTLQVLRQVPELAVEEIESGCCGMAGTFGYEQEHYEFSMKVGESRLFPAVRKLPKDAIVIADGLSCRSQIEHGTERHAQHLISFLASRLKA